MSEWLELRYFDPPDHFEPAYFAPYFEPDFNVELDEVGRERDRRLRTRRYCTPMCLQCLVSHRASVVSAILPERPALEVAI